MAESTGLLKTPRSMSLDDTCSGIRFRETARVKAKEGSRFAGT